MNEYIIVNKTAIQKRIEELEKDYNEKDEANDEQWCSIICGQIIALKQILSQSTPLIPEIEKAWLDGNLGCSRDYSQDYISNLKLDI